VAQQSRQRLLDRLRRFPRARPAHSGLVPARISGLFSIIVVNDGAAWRWPSE